MKAQQVFWFVLAFLFYSSIVHEATHALVALAFGYRVLGIHFGVPWSYVRLSGSNWIVYLSGGLVNAIGLLCVWRWGRQYFTFKERFWIFFLMMLEFGYSIFEGFIYPHL